MKPIKDIILDLLMLYLIKNLKKKYIFTNTDDEPKGYDGKIIIL